MALILGVWRPAKIVCRAHATCEDFHVQRQRSLIMASSLPGVAPLFPAGREPLPPGLTEEDREVIKQQKYYQDLITEAPHSCVGKGVISTGAGA